MSISLATPEISLQLSKIDSWIADKKVASVIWVVLRPTVAILVLGGMALARYILFGLPAQIYAFEGYDSPLVLGLVILLILIGILAAVLSYSVLIASWRVGRVNVEAVIKCSSSLIASVLGIVFLLL